jgi:hypothetical protein
VGVRHAETDRILARFSGKGRLSVRAIAKGQAFWRSVQVVAEDGPEHSTSDDKVLAVSLKVKPFGPRLFVFRKVMEKALNL